jgi:hypothetical protein
MKTIDQRISILERKMGYVKGRVPGTQLSRTLNPIEGIEWTLSLGLFQERKKFFTAPTIQKCLRFAEKELL